MKREWTSESRTEWGRFMKGKLAEQGSDGRLKSELVSKKCSEASKSWWDTHPEAKERMKVRHISEETRKKCADAARRGWETRARTWTMKKRATALESEAA
jgi:hypothetical protein